MSHLSTSRVGALSAAAALTVAGAFATTAQASPYGQPVTARTQVPCTLPGAGSFTAAITTDSYNWNAIPVGSGAPGTDTNLSVSFTGIGALLRDRGASDVQVAGTWGWRIEGPGGTVSTSTRAFTGSGFATSAAAATTSARIGGPSYVTTQLGTYRNLLDELSFTLRATDASGAAVAIGSADDADGDASTANVTCSGPRLEVSYTGTAPSNRPAAPVIESTRVTATSAALVLGESSSFVQSYEITGGPTVVRLRATDAEALEVTGLSPDTTYTFRVTALSAYGTSEPSAPVTVTTKREAQTLELTASGSFGLRGPLAGSGRIAGSVRGTIDSDGTFEGAAALGSTTATFRALGVLPVRATVALAEAPATGGDLSTGGYTLTTAPAVTIRSASLLGLPLSTGQCRTAVSPTVTLEGATGTLDQGGRATASFGLGRLTGCNAFGGLIGTSGYVASLDLNLAASAGTN